MSNPPTGASAPNGPSPDDAGEAAAQAAECLREALALLDRSGGSKEAAAYIQTALDCLEPPEAS